MKGKPDPNPALLRRQAEAAEWVLRLDRGLTPQEQDAFFDWLGAHPENGSELARHRSDWKRLDKLAEWRPEHGELPNPDLLAPQPQPRRKRAAWILAPLALAAAAALAFVYWRSAARPSSGPAFAEATTALKRLPEGHWQLEDGSLVQLKEDAAVESRFTASERRVVLERGEAFFMVAKDPERPFVVEARGAAVSAVGTSFNVRLGDDALEVLVASGRVQVEPPRRSGGPEVPGAPESEPPPLLHLRQRAVIPFDRDWEPIRIDTLTSSEIERVLAWHHCLLEFDEAPLSEVVEEFNRRNAEKIELADADLASVRISGAFRSDHLEAFTRLLETGFGAVAERRGEDVVALRLAK